ncbi:g7434 [Coccomyxa viridis]|uniref:G7434 protein n=1 Tax=Coccomyxa viridis TaxID=1274662 RepID=A0ABP1G089_9CHLO
MWAGVAAVLFVSTALAVSTESVGSIHTVFTTECTPYFTWQSLGFMLSYKLSEQPGRVTRLLSCTPEALAVWEDDGIIPTELAPSWTVHPQTGDIYSGINKPVAVFSWYRATKPTEDYIIIVDADMIMLKPFDPPKMGVKPGWAVSAFFGYLKGVNNELALKHVPEVLPRNDSLAGPVGRRGDQVGGFTIFRNEDLGSVLPMWIKYTEDVREDPDAWNTSGDSYTTEPGLKPWIAEMYGYSFGCSSVDVWHLTDHRAMLYPGYMPYSTADLPNVLHYGLLYGVEEKGWEFDKHWYQDFNALRCPPWEVPPAGERPKQGLFPFPPRPSSLTSKGEALLRDLLAIHVIAHLNEALCQNYRKMCNASVELTQQCNQVDDLFDEVVSAREELRNMSLRTECHDFEERCPQWASKGECGLNPNFMLRSCQKSCGLCGPGVDPSGAVDLSVGTQPTMHTLALDAVQTPPAKALAKGGHQNPDDQAGTHATAAKEAAAHIFGRTTSEDKTVHDIATPDIKQRMADTMAVLNADTAQKALDDAARDIESAALQKPKGQGATTQGQVDAESVALQKPETQQAVKQVQVDAESAQLQKPETQQVADKAAVRAEENAQLQQPQDVAASGKGVEEKGGAGQLATGGGGMKAPVKEEAPLTGIQKFKHDLAEALQQQERQRQERRCLANPALSMQEVKECMDALAAGREWHPARGSRQQLLEDENGVETQGALDTLLPGEAGGEGVDGEGYGGRSFGDRVFGNPLGKGAVVLLLVALLLKAPWRRSKQSPLLKVYRHD